MQVTSFVEVLISKFNPADVFSSLQGFIGSGYVLIILFVMLALGIIKKITKLLFICAVSFVVWYLFTAGYLDGVLAPLNEIIFNVSNTIH